MLKRVSSYEESVKRLNSLQSNASIIAQLLVDTKQREQMNAKSIPEMREFLARMGINRKYS